VPVSARYFPKRERAAWEKRYVRPEATGLCYPYANLALRRFGDKAVVVHGRVRHLDRMIPHAWIEHGGRVYDYQNAELRNTSFSVAEYYRRMGARNVKRYTPEQACINAVRQGHHGPWGLSRAR
jgi:hypothetical protein